MGCVVAVLILVLKDYCENNNSGKIITQVSLQIITRGILPSLEVHELFVFHCVKHSTSNIIFTEVQRNRIDERNLSLGFVSD